MTDVQGVQQGDFNSLGIVFHKHPALGKKKSPHHTWTMDTGSIETLVQYFTQKVRLLKQSVVLCDATGNDDYKEVAEKIDSRVDDLLVMLKTLRNEVDQQKDVLAQIENVKKSMSLCSESSQYAVKNIPTKLPSASRKITSTSCAPTPQKGQGHHNGGQKSESQGQGPPTSQSEGSSGTRCSYLEFLTVEEFEDVPKYMKGRLSYDKVNSVIEKLDHVFMEKYKILRCKKSKLNDLNRKRYENYKMQESKDTAGVAFVVEADMVDFSSLKMDSSMRSIMTVLRHTGLLCEVRGDGHVRFAIRRY